MRRRARWTAVLIAASTGLSLAASGPRPDPAAKVERPRAEQPSIAQARRQIIGRAVRFLRRSQAEDGSFSPQLGSDSAGVTAIVVTGLLRTGSVLASDPMVARALKSLEAVVKDTGAVGERKHSNYVTCMALMAFQQANTDGRYDPLIKRGLTYLRGIQWDESKQPPVNQNDTRYGGVGYGSQNRPDLSNTAVWIEALHQLGVPPDDPGMKRALVFVSRCEALHGEHNDQPFAMDFGPDNPDTGGSIYTPVGGGMSQNGAPPGRPVPYGSMTYAGLKSMIYAGLTKDDPRVKAAMGWIDRHYALDRNPGMPAQRPQQGLYYYYQMLAKTLNVLGIDEVRDRQGRLHPWRSELVQELARLQQPDGSWVNEDDRWYEGDPNLVTGYVLMILGQVRGR